MNSTFQFLTSILLIILQVIDCYSPQNCDPNVESLFVEDPTDRQAFFSCKPYANYPSIGFWSRHYCPNNMHFEYNSQQCITENLPPNTVREANDLLQIAILNGSCAHGEQCIGGTVCDPIQQKCLCPYGSVALLETLYCAKLIPPVDNNFQEQYSYGSQYSSQASLQSTQEITTSSLSPPVNSPVPIGSYCDQEETCDGGSACINSICVCPAKTRNNGNNCTSILNPSNSNSIGQQSTKELLGQGTFFKAKLGEQCNEYLGLFCADQSSICVNGYCQCIPPMIELQGQCQMPLIKEAGPGELCNSGQVCVKGSVCNKQIPLCVCPEGTELVKGTCVQRDLKKTLNEEKPKDKLHISNIETTSSTQIKIRPSKIEAKVGEKCSLNADCASGAYCNGNTQPPTCQCLSTHISVNDHCEKVIYPGQKGCETDLQCNAGYAGARCLNGQCVCPPGSSAIEQTCIPELSRREFSLNNKSKTSSKIPKLSATFMKGDEEIFASETISSISVPIVRTEESKREQMTAAPGAQCGPLDVCTGGSTCVEGLCLCPAGTRPSLKNDNCETFEQRKSSIQQEQSIKEFSKYTSKMPRMQPGPIDRPYARPSESCANREICTGGSICQNISKVCECPSNKPILRNHICIQSDEPPMLRVINALPGDKCNSETNCEGFSVCVEGTCRCKNNDFTPKRGNCTKRSASSSSDILPPVQLSDDSSEFEEVNQQHPRISGPPLRKQSSASIISNILPQLTIGEPSEPGICPPGNSPTINRSTGQIIKCNGMAPKCPPKSYCYVRGDASETYNCCKSY